MTDTPQSGRDAWRQAIADYRKRQRTQRARGNRNPRNPYDNATGVRAAQRTARLRRETTPQTPATEHPCCAEGPCPQHQQNAQMRWTRRQLNRATRPDTTTRKETP